MPGRSGRAGAGLCKAWNDRLREAAQHCLIISQAGQVDDNIVRAGIHHALGIAR